MTHPESIVYVYIFLRRCEYFQMGVSIMLRRYGVLNMKITRINDIEKR